MIVYAIVDEALSPEFPLGDSLEVFIRREDAERFVVRWELAVQAWPRPAPPKGAPEPDSGADGYEDDPTLPWWDTPPEEPSRRLLRVAVGLAVALVLGVVIGAFALG